MADSTFKPSNSLSAPNEERISTPLAAEIVRKAFLDPARRKFEAKRDAVVVVRNIVLALVLERVTIVNPVPFSFFTKTK